jgi:hypothetical protein
MTRNEMIFHLVEYHRAMDDQQLLGAWRAAFGCDPAEYLAAMERDNEAFLAQLRAMK